MRASPSAEPHIRLAAQVAKAEGTLSLWNGYLPYYGRCGGHTVLMFLFVAELRKHF